MQASLQGVFTVENHTKVKMCFAFQRCMVDLKFLTKELILMALLGGSNSETPFCAGARSQYFTVSFIY